MEPRRRAGCERGAASVLFLGRFGFTRSGRIDRSRSWFTLQAIHRSPILDGAEDFRKKVSASTGRYLCFLPSLHSAQPALPRLIRVLDGL